MIDTDAIKAQLGTITSTRLPLDWDAEEFERWCVDNLRALIAEVEKLRQMCPLDRDGKHISQGAANALMDGYYSGIEKVKELRAEVERLKDVLHLDRSGLAHALNQVQHHIEGWGWIPAKEWGSYDYTQHTPETLQREVGDLIDGAVKIITDAVHASGDLAHAECCGRKPRKHPLQAEVERLRAEVAKYPVDNESLTLGEEIIRDLEALG